MSQGLRLRIVSEHPLVVSCLENLLLTDPNFSPLLLSPLTDIRSLSEPVEPAVFVVDVFSSPVRLAMLARTLRIRARGSRFVALVTPEEGGQDSILSLLHGGIEGVVVLDDHLREELPRAIREVMEGELWAPQSVLAEYVRQTRVLLNEQVLPRLPLTGRESQILQLMIRRLSNAEIAEAVRISERTVRYHVANIFQKLRVQDRRSLLATLASLEHKTA